MNRKNIVHFVPELNEGGAEKLVCDYCEYLLRDGYNVILFEIFPPYDSITYQRIQDMGIQLYSVYPKKNKFYLWVNKHFAHKYIPYKLKRLITRTKPQVIHLHLSWLRFFVLMSEYLKNKSIKLFYTCHNTPSVYFSGRKVDEFYAAKKLIEQNNLRLLALSSQMQNELNRMFSINNVKVIHNAVISSIYGSAAMSKADIRKKLGIPEDAFVIGNIGRFTEQKNHKFLIQIFCELKIRKINAFLLLIGSGELKKEIEELICKFGMQDDVLILSGRTDIPDILNAMDVFVFPSLYEGLGIALIEAQLAELRCVVADCIPLDAYITDKVIGLSLEDGIDKWVDAILKQEFTGIQYACMRDYVMSDEIKKLEALYNEQARF